MNGIFEDFVVIEEEYNAFVKELMSCSKKPLIDYLCKNFRILPSGAIK